MKIIPFNKRSIEYYNVPMKCGMGEGFSFEDIKVGTTFYLSPNKLKYSFGLNNMNSEQDFINSQGPAVITDKYIVIKKYERAENLNPYIKKKYTIWENFWCKNLRTKTTFELNPDVVCFLYIDCI